MAASLCDTNPDSATETISRTQRWAATGGVKLSINHGDSPLCFDSRFHGFHVEESLEVWVRAREFGAIFVPRRFAAFLALEGMEVAELRCQASVGMANMAATFSSKAVSRVWSKLTLLGARLGGSLCADEGTAPCARGSSASL